MYAIIQTGGKQYQVKKGDIIQVELLDAQPGQLIDLNEVLLIAQEGQPAKIGQPTLQGCSVKAQYITETRGPKIQSMKYKRRKGEYRKFGHRQRYAQLKIVDINI